MTYEEGKAIERLNRFKAIKVLYTKTFAMTTEQLKVIQEDIETVLSMLKENSAEIEQKNTELAEKNAEIEKKDKIIDLMLKAMDKIQDPQVCKYCDNKINLNHGYCTDAGKCKKGIKQYFERKSEEC